jgi:TolA-binding protein
VALRATDYVSNINLVYALLGQDKRDEAVVIYRRLIDRYPTNDRVVKLGKALGQL